MNRREFVTRTGAAVAAGSTLFTTSALTAGEDKAAGKNCKGDYRNPLPRWRGFNLMAFFAAMAENPQYCDQTLRPNELDWIRDWGFDYVRLPIDYWMFVDSDWKQTGEMDIAKVRNLNEAAYERLDKAIDLCIARGLHITVNMHRCPGYCINGWEREPYNLFKDAQAEDDFEFHWRVLAERYKSITTKHLSFNLLNEAPNTGELMEGEDYNRVMRRVSRAIRDISPDRLIIVDGTGVGTRIVPGLIDEPLAQAVHAYAPHELSHFEARWTPMFMGIDTPTWPAKLLDGTSYDRRHLELYFAPWGEMVRQGIGVHCGETGCYNRTPHAVFLRWFEDVLDILKGYDIGYAMWNFNGDFGPLNSGRSDVVYEDWYGYKLDRKLLDLIRKY